MPTDPVYITFEFRGDLDKEVEKVTLAIKGLRDESAKTYQRLIADSNSAYNAMSAESRNMAVSVQENINALRDLSVAQKALDTELEAGSITTRQYSQVKAVLAIQEQNLREAISSGIQALGQQTATEQQAADSVVQLTQRLKKLTETYYNMSKAEREGSAGQGVLREIGEVDKEIQAAQNRLSAYSRSAGTGFNGLSMSIQQVARELPSLTMGANMFFLAISNNLPILADEIARARKEYDTMTRSGQSATPVWKQLLSGIVSWQTALVVGITILSMYGKEIITWAKSLVEGRKSLADTLETLEEFQESVADTSASTVAQLQRMAAEWTALGDNLEAKELYILNNKSAFDELGVAISDVSEVENIFVTNKDKFIDSITARAQAAAAMEMAAEEYKKAIQKMQEAEAMPEKKTYTHYVGQLFRGEWVTSEYDNPDRINAQAEADKLFQSGNGLINKYIQYSDEEQQALEKIGVKTTDALVAGSVGAIKASIQQKQEALNQLTNKADYDKALREIEAEQQKLEAITGKKGNEEDEPAPFGSLKYYDDLIAKTRKLRDTAVTDETRKQFDDQLKEYEAKVKEMENNIILSGKKVAVETLQSTVKGLENVHGKFDTRMDIEKEFGDLDTSDLDKLNKKIKETDERAEEARRGIIGLIDAWDTLSDSDEAFAIGEECYKIADGLSYAAETAELFDEALGSALATSAQLVGSVGDIAGGIGRAMSGDIIGGAAGIIGGVTGIIGSFKKRVEENKSILAEYQLSLVETAMKELEYNAILRERLRLTQQINETSIEYFARQSVELEKQSGAIEKEYAEVWEKLQGEQYITATHYRHGTWFRKAKTWNDYGSLAGKTYEEIESLYTQDKLTDSAKVLFEQLQKLKEEGEDVAGMIDDLNEEMKESFTGTTVDSIADSILQGFAEGKRSAKDFADDFQEMLNNAVLQGVKMKVLEEPLRQWYESFAAASQNGLTAENIASLKSQYDKIIEDAARQLENMEKVTGVAIGDAGRTSAEKGIASMNQESSDELNGNFYALLIYADKTSQGVTSIRESLIQGITLLERIAKNTDRLETIEKDIRTIRGGFQDVVNRGLIIRRTV